MIMINVNIMIMIMITIMINININLFRHLGCIRTLQGAYIGMLGRRQLKAGMVGLVSIRTKSELKQNRHFVRQGACQERGKVGDEIIAHSLRYH